MGNASNVVLIILAIDLFMGMIALGIASVDNTSPLLLSNKLFGTTSDSNDNVVISNTNIANGVTTYDYNATTFDSLGSTSNSILSTSSFIFPDWIRSGWKFMMSTGRTYINFVGSPFTIVSSTGIDSDLSAIIGSFFGIFITFIMLNWLLGRDN